MREKASQPLVLGDKEGKGRWGGGRILEKEMKDGVFSEQGDL